MGGRPQVSSQFRSIWTFERCCRPLYVALILLTIISLYPRLKTGFTTNDDTEIALAAIQGQTFLQAVNTALTQGRFCEFFLILGLAIPHLFQNPIYYYAIAISAILSNIVSFYVLLRLVLGSERVALLITGLATAFLQYNWQHGLLTSYPFAYCFALTCFIWSVIFYYEWLRARKLLQGVLTGALFFLALLISEGFAPYFVIFLGLSIYHASTSHRSLPKLGNICQTFLPVAISLGLYVFIWIAFAKAHAGIYPGVHIGVVSPTRIARVLWQFSVSTLPSYFYWRDPKTMVVTFDGLSAPVWGLKGLVQSLRVEWIVKGTILFFFCAWLLRPQRRMSGSFFSLAFAAGIACVIAPISLQTTTVKYQQWVIDSQALAHMNCYYAYFGTVFALGLVLLMISQVLTWSKILSFFYVTIISFLLAIASLATDKYNYYVSLDQQLSNLKWRAIDRLLQTDDFKALKAECVIYSPTLFSARGIVANFPHYWTDYLSARAGKKVFVAQTAEEFFDRRREHPQSECYFLSYHQEPKDPNQFMILAKAPYFTSPNKEAVYSKEAVLFTYSKYRSFVLIGRSRPGKPATVRVDNQPVTEMSGNVFTHKVDKSNSPGDFPKITIESSTAIDVAHLTISYLTVIPRFATLDISYTQGFYGPEKNKTTHSYWSWSSGDAEITIWNELDREIETCLKLDLVTFSAPRTVTISCWGMQQTVTLRPEEHVTPTSVHLLLRPGENKIHFKTDRPGQPVGNGDPRSMTFAVQNAAFCDTAQ